MNDEFGFTLDVCSTYENVKCANLFTLSEDGRQRAVAFGCGEAQGRICRHQPSTMGPFEERAQGRRSPGERRPSHTLPGLGTQPRTKVDQTHHLEIRGQRAVLAVQEPEKRGDIPDVGPGGVR